MNREQKFIDYLEGLKTPKNAKLLESISEGFKTLVEYRIDGNPSEKLVDIMESGDEISASDVGANDTNIEGSGDMGDLDTNTLVEDDSVSPEGTSEESNSVVLEVGEGEVKSKLSAELLRSIDNAIEQKIHKMAQIIDSQHVVESDAEKMRYLNNMRSQLWRSNLLEKGINPSSVKGLVPSINESIESADLKLLDFIDSAFMILNVDREK